MRHLKTILIVLTIMLVTLEIIFNFILPNIIKLDKYKPLITELLQKQTKLSLNYENAKIITTPLFGIGIKANNISIKLPDNSPLFSADSIKTRISLPSILLFTVKVSCLEIEKPLLNIDIINNENYKIVNLIENIVNENKMKNLENPKPKQEDGLKFNPEWIRIKIPCIKLSDYNVMVNDLKSGHYLKLHGEDMQLGYFNGKKAKFKTIAQLYSDDHKNITLDANITTVLPKQTAKLDEEDDEPERMDIPFTNPVTMYRKYDLKTDIATKLNIRGNDRTGYTSYGFLGINNLTLKLGKSQLPENNISLKMFAKNIDFNADLNIKEQQGIKTLGKLRYGSNPNINMYLKTDKIYFNDIIILTEALLDSLSIPNELSTVSANGYFEADTTIKTNFKKLKSNGFIRIRNGALKIRNLGELIAKTNISLLFDDNMLKIDNSSLLLNNSKIEFLGNINKKNVANINVASEKINLPKLFMAFCPKEIRNNYNLNSGILSLVLNIEGKLKHPNIKADLLLENLNLNDNKRTFNISNESTKLSTIIIKKKINMNFNNDKLSLKISPTKSTIYLPNIKFNLNDKNISISENQIKINNKTQINYKGFINDYNKLSNINISANSSLNTADIMKLIGQGNSKYFHFNGSLPFEFSLSGSKNKITVNTKLSADKYNYFTPIRFLDLENKDTLTQLIMDIKPQRIKIKDTGLFNKSVTYDKRGKEQVHLTDIIKINGTIAGNNINILRVNIPKELNGNIFVFPKSTFNINKCHTFVMGRVDNPRALGNISVSDVKIPELLLTIKDISTRIKGRIAHIKVKNLLVNNSDLDIQGDIDILSMPIEISKLIVNSQTFDVDKVMKVLEKLATYMPASQSSVNTTSNSQVSDIPLIIKNSKIDFKHLKTGNINISDIKSDISLDKNIFFLNNLSANIFDGRTNGDISVNLLNSLINIDLNGKNINVEKALHDSANMKNTLSGKCLFDTKLSLQGSCYEDQIKSLKGCLNFTIKDGQFGPFGKLENLILAENIRESEFFKTALGGIISSIATIDTTHFSNLSGKLNFENGICRIDEMTSEGKVLALHIFGDFNIIKNYADMKVRAKMTSIISNLLGPIAMINPVNIMNSAAGLNPITAKAFSLFCETVTNDEINKLPPFSNNYTDNAATKFQLVIRGDAAKPLTLVKSFKWLTTQIEFNKANAFVESIPDIPEGSTAMTVKELIEENAKLEAEKKTLKYKLIHVLIPRKK